VFRLEGAWSFVWGAKHQKPPVATGLTRAFCRCL